MANEHLKAIDPTFYEECQIFRQPKVVLKADQNSLYEGLFKFLNLSILQLTCQCDNMF